MAVCHEKSENDIKRCISVAFIATRKRREHSKMTREGASAVKIQQEEKWRQRGQRTTAGQLLQAPGGPEEDTGLASAARGQKEDNCKHQQHNRTSRTQRPGARPATVASSFFLERTPTVNCLVKKQSGLEPCKKEAKRTSHCSGTHISHSPQSD